MSRMSAASPRGSTRCRSPRPRRVARPRNRAGSADSRRTTRTSTPRAWGAPLQLPHLQVGRDPIEPVDRTILADERARELTVPAQAHATLHAALERQPDRVSRNAAVLELASGEPHHDLRAAQEHRVVGLDRHPVEQLRDDADRPEPVTAGTIDDHLEPDVEPAAPALQLLAEHQLRWRAGAVEDRHCLLYTSDAADERSSVDLG